MDKHRPVERIRSELQKGMGLAKCRKCGCMKDALENMKSFFSTSKTEGSSDLLTDIEQWVALMEQVKYSCLGCEYCISAAAANIFNQAFPEASEAGLSCGLEMREQTWPPVPGEYFDFCDGPGCPVAVSTLASAELAEALAAKRPKELCIVGKTETENIGIDKIVKNTITNPTIHFLLLAGKDPKGHHSGRTLLALWKNGVDRDMSVIGSPGRRPVLRNVTREEVEAFRRQVEVVDLIGCEDVEVIVEKLKELSEGQGASCRCEECTEKNPLVQVSSPPVIQAQKPAKMKLDRAGYFVIVAQPEKGVITVEHYSPDNRLLRVIEGIDARSIYGMIIGKGWLTELSHAAYLGKELAKAELSIKLGFKYVQDSTETWEREKGAAKNKEAAD